jgi:hypothetical protein
VTTALAAWNRSAVLKRLMRLARSLVRTWQPPLGANAMCNLYSVTRGQEAIRRLFEIQRDLIGNMPLIPAM